MLEMFGGAFLQIMNIPIMLLCLLGTVLGIFFGAAPGMTSSMGIALVLPITYGMSMEYGMALILGIYIGSISGSLITAILINIPGTPASVATTFDGYPMALRGEGGRAVRVAILYSFLGGIVSLMVLFFISPVLAKWALKFGPVEYFSIAVFSLTLIASLSGDSIIKGVLSALLGVMFTTVGMAPVDSVFRYTFGFHELDAGVQLLPVLVGVFAITEIIKAAEDRASGSMKLLNYKSKGLGVSWKEFKDQFRNFMVSAGIGTGIGTLPGLGAAISNLVAYSISRDSSKHPEKYGTGIIDGLVASETANNAVSGGALIPLLTMGIPGDAGTAMMLAAFMLHGITPGPLLFTTHGKLIYAMFAILFVANIMMFALQMYGLPFFLKLLKIPKNILFPIIIVLASVGAFAMNNRVFDIWSILFFGLVGYGLYKFKFPSAPLVLGFVLGNLLEINFRRGAMSTYGNFGAFFTQPISGTVFALTVLFIAYNIYNSIQKYKKNKTSEV